MESSFAKTLSEFCADLRGTFPEQERAIDRLSTINPDMFWQMWKGSLPLLVECDAAALFRDRRGLLAGAVRLTPTVWGELSATTRAALWAHLRILTLESAMVQPSLEQETVETLIQLAGGPTADEAPEGPELLSFFMEKLKGFMDISGLMDTFADMSGSGSGPESEAEFMAGFPPIPEHLQTGTLATLVKELIAQFNPAEFGLDPELFSGTTDMKTILERILEVSNKEPEKMMAGAKRMGDKIKTRISGGSLNRAAVMAELKEFYSLLKDHPLCKQAFEKMEEMGLGALFHGTTNAPSDRIRVVRERLRRKQAAKQQAKHAQ